MNRFSVLQNTKYRKGYVPIICSRIYISGGGGGGGDADDGDDNR
jgi:hypothetical protein